MASAIGHAYQRQDDHEKALKWLKLAYESDPSSRYIMASYGSELIGKVLNKPGAITDGALSDQDIEDIGQAAKILDKVWVGVKNTEFARALRGQQSTYARPYPH